MRTIMARTPHDSSFSFSKRHFQWILRKSGGVDSERSPEDEAQEQDHEEETLSFTSNELAGAGELAGAVAGAVPIQKKRAASASVVVSRFRQVLMAAIAGKNRSRGLGTRVTGTLFGHRRGHVHFAFQVDSKACPVVIIELATPTSGLVREMASGLVRIALECEKKPENKKKGVVKLLEEPLWRTYCNGKKCGYAVRRECSAGDWKVLRAVEPVSMGAGVLPGEEGGSEGELMYMRARFERVVGSRDSEAFYMMNPDGNGGPELSIYLLRV